MEWTSNRTESWQLDSAVPGHGSLAVDARLRQHLHLRDVPMAATVQLLILEASLHNLPQWLWECRGSAVASIVQMLQYVPASCGNGGTKDQHGIAQPSHRFLVLACHFVFASATDCHPCAVSSGIGID